MYSTQDNTKIGKVKIRRLTTKSTVNHKIDFSTLLAHSRCENDSLIKTHIHFGYEEIDVSQ